MGLTQFEAMGKAMKADRFNSRRPGEPGHWPRNPGKPEQTVRPAAVIRQTECSAADQVQGPGRLHGDHKLLTGPPFLFDVRTDYIKVTADTVLVPITLQIRNRDMTFNTKDGVAKGIVNILGRVSTISRQASTNL